MNTNTNTNDADKNAAGNIAAWWVAITLITVQVALAVVLVGGGYALQHFQGTQAAWMGLAETLRGGGDLVRSVPAWWALAPSALVLALGLAFCAVRWTTAHARAVETRAAMGVDTSQLPEPANGKVVTLAERHARKHKTH